MRDWHLGELSRTKEQDTDQPVPYLRVSLGTSKLNYIDPRLTFAWCKKYEVPIEKMFSKTLREKLSVLPSCAAVRTSQADLDCLLTVHGLLLLLLIGNSESSCPL